MVQDSAILGCSSCGTKNRVPKDRLKDNPLCGKCKTILEPETLFLAPQSEHLMTRVSAVGTDQTPDNGSPGRGESELARRIVPMET